MPTTSDIRTVIVTYDPDTLTYGAWNGVLKTGSVVIGAVTQSGTWTVQPGNTVNTTAWKVDGSGVTQPVSGTFWQVTQPVSIATMPSTPVTGTFWQATQPVSIATMPSTPVTGTFWQATQPISNSNLDTNVDAKISTLATATAQTTGNTTLSNIQTALTRAQAAAISGLTGPLVLGSVSDAREVYVDNTVQPISLTTDGRLRVSTSVATTDLDHFTIGDQTMDYNQMYPMVNCYE